MRNKYTSTKYIIDSQCQARRVALTRARSRRAFQLLLSRTKKVLSFGAVVFGFYIASKLASNIDIFNPIQAATAPTREVEVVEKVSEVEIIKEVEVNRVFITEKQKILAYIVEKFGDDAADAITMIRKCENSSFNPQIVSPLNIQKSGRRSYDVGVMQINVDENNTEEIQRLKDWKYNIDRGYQKYVGRGKKFTDWTCAHVIGQKNYLGQ